MFVCGGTCGQSLYVVCAWVVVWVGWVGWVGVGVHVRVCFKYL